MLRQVKPQDHKLRDFFLCAFSAILLSLSFSSFNIWIFAWFGFVPLFLALQNKSRLQSFLLSFLTGFLFWSCAIYWLIHVTLAGTIILVLYLALYFGLFGIVINSKVISRKLQVTNLIFIPAVWVVLEYVRGYLFTGFPWALLAYSQYSNLPAIQIADITGVWGVSFIVMFVNVGIYEIVSRKLQVTRLPLDFARGRQGHRVSYILLGMVCLVIFGYGYFKLYLQPSAHDLQPIKISVIQADIPQELKWDQSARSYIFNRYSSLTEECSRDKPDLIVWPEASNPEIPGEENLIFRKILNLAKQVRIPLLIGSVIKEGEDYFNSALLISPSGEIVDRYDKLHLVPFGEYIPLKDVLPFLQTVVPIGDMRPGKRYALFSHKMIKYSVLICFEDVFPELSRRFAAKGASLLINITNDAWYKKTSAPFQHLAASVFRAVENRVPLARSANTGISGFIDATGKIRYFEKDDNKIFVEGYKTGGIFLDPAHQKSIYTEFGDIFVLICLIFALIFGVSVTRLRRE
ncbi:MAG: apolipoprotein N-acyltransferase [Candidatus Omnitrophica bacterium]|nr:apolipoprotein N-acyltransferase [Candidatus Omnitrophota bacterium]MBU1869510.1 apolipoprotein N-acyltransferase [Candidatus Omnitrophota bacterium]